jgi:uncharacterized membrane protein YfcA
MVIGAVFLWLSAKDDHASSTSRHGESEAGKKPALMIVREIVDAEGVRYRYGYNPVVGIVLSVFVGFVSSLLGVGGGFIHVPALSRLLNFPVHIATATSHFVLAVMALTGTLVHVVNGVFVHGLRRTALLTVGVIFGAQIGARLSNRVGGKMIIRGLAVALLFVGVRLILAEF